MLVNNGSLDVQSLISFPKNSGVFVTEAYIDPHTLELIIRIDFTEDIQDR